MIDNTESPRCTVPERDIHVCTFLYNFKKLIISIQIEYPLFGESELNGVLDLLTTFGEMVLQSG